MQLLKPAICGLFAIATVVTSAAAAADNPMPQRPGPEAASLGGKGGSMLRAVTLGMRRGAAQDGGTARERIALARPEATAATRGALVPSHRAVVIDVLVAYTRKAASHYADIERQLVAVAVEQANQSFRLSDIGHIELRLVRTYQTQYVEEGTHFDHVWRFADKGDGYMDEVHGLRDAYRADIAVLVVDDAKGCGLATRVQADADEAFAVVHRECAVANYTLAHEIGHIIGASHDLGYVRGTSWRDIMSYKERCGGCPRLPIWSNPTLLIEGEPAGTAELDNARVIAEQARRVAAFR
jgi:hypothetical protein